MFSPTSDSSTPLICFLYIIDINVEVRETTPHWNQDY